MMRSLIATVVFCLLCSCVGRKMSPEELQQKLDSVKAVEVKEQLELQGIHLEESDNPLQIFYDSLEIQPLPLSYSEDYVRFLPAFKSVTPDIISYMELEGVKEPKAITLPESVGTRLMLLATDENDGQYSLWLYSLDNDYYPVDKLCLYAVPDKEEMAFEELEPEEFVQYFSISSDYEIHLLDYSKEQYKARLEEVYYIDASRKFVLRSSKEE